MMLAYYLESNCFLSDGITKQCLSHEWLTRKEILYPFSDARMSTPFLEDLETATKVLDLIYARKILTLQVGFPFFSVFSPQFGVYHL